MLKTAEMENGRLAIMAPAAQPPPSLLPPSPSLQAYKNALRYLPHFGLFCIIRKRAALSSVRGKSHVISYLGLDGQFYRSIKGFEA